MVLEAGDYREHLRRIRPLLIVSSLQKRADLKAIGGLIREFSSALVWEPLSDLSIDPDIWKYASNLQGYDPKLVCRASTEMRLSASSGLDLGVVHHKLPSVIGEDRVLLGSNLSAPGERKTVHPVAWKTPPGPVVG
jgi:hypothetical protein